MLHDIEAAQETLRALLAERNAAQQARDEAVTLMRPFAARVHPDGIDVPYPFDEGEWPRRFDAIHDFVAACDAAREKKP